MTTFSNMQCKCTNLIKIQKDLASIWVFEKYYAKKLICGVC